MSRLLLLALFISALPLASNAQLLLTGLERNLDVAMSPEYPGAGDTVSIKIGGYGLDLDRSTVTWYANGRQLAQGAGLRSAAVTAGALGSETVVEIVAEEVSTGIIGSARVVIRPTEVDLLWQPDSYVPPFFKGRAFAGTNAQIKAQALARFKRPNGTLVPESDIIYAWYKGSTRVDEGRGKSGTSFPGPALFGSDEISVVAESADGTYKGRASVRIQGVDPSIELYENHPLFGVLYHRALVGSVATLENEQKVTAVPYFAHVVSPHSPDLTYAWKVDGVDISPNPDAPDTLTVVSRGYIGPAGITLSLTSAVDWFLRATGSWELVFSETSAVFSDPFGTRR